MMVFLYHACVTLAINETIQHENSIKKKLDYEDLKLWYAQAIKHHDKRICECVPIDVVLSSCSILLSRQCPTVACLCFACKAANN